MNIWTPVAIPALIAGIVLVVSWRAWRRRDLSPTGHWGGAIAFSAAYLTGHELILSWPALPPKNSADWLAWIAAALAILGAGQRWWGAKWLTAIPVRLTVSAAVSFALLQGPLEHQWGREEGWAWLAGVSLAMALQWQSFEVLAAIRPGASLPISVWAYCAMSAATFLKGGAASLGQLAGALAAAAGAATVLAWWARGLRLSGGAMAAFVPIYSGLLIRAYFLGELSPWAAGLLYLAPYALWYAEQRRFVYTRPWRAALIRVALVGAPAGLALGISWWIASRAGPAGGY